MLTKKFFAVLTAAVLTLTLASCSTGSGSSAKKITSPADFSGAKIAVQTATTASDSVDAMNTDGKIEVSRYEKVTQCFDDLRLGRVDAVYVDSVVAAYYTNGRNDYERVWLSDEAEPMGICLKKDAADLAAAVEAAVNTLYFNGKIAEIAQKNFGDNLSKDLRGVTEAPVIPTGFTTKTAGKLTVGMEVGYPPMEYTSDDGKDYLGFDVDVAKALAELLGLEVEYVNTAWDGIFAGLDKGQYDIIMSAVSITPERQEKYILTEPYVANALCIVTKK
ncbi:hypothetical protein FACS18949_02490 [Clostridia bacterium]|nr:hypothetical protein FACS18949_02490 [Clostridia bacterium]